MPEPKNKSWADEEIERRTKRANAALVDHARYEHSTTRIELFYADPETGRSKLIILAKYQNITKIEAVDALFRARENNPSLAKMISMQRVEYSAIVN